MPCDLVIEKLVENNETNAQRSEEVNESVAINNIAKNGKTFQCTICQKMFSRLNFLKIHERLHTGILPFECATCRQKFKLKAALHA